MPSKSSAKKTAPLFLGIDTGGTYTDAVLWSEATGVAAKAKALTTRHDLAVGISGAVDAVLAKAAVAPSAIKLVSMSTTLATNALVEGQGGRVALVMIGFSEADLARDGLQAALGTDPVLFVPGGHDVHGNAARSTSPRWRRRCRSWRPASPASRSAPISPCATRRTRSPPAS